MTKYSTDFKLQVVTRYLTDTLGLYHLSKEFGVEQSIIRRWIHTAKEQGLMALKVNHTRKNYTLDFKSQVVNYYQTHDLGTVKVAAKFNINASQVYSWNKAFIEDGIAALIPKQQGRPTTVKKKPSIKKKHISLSEKQEYEEKLMRLEAKLHEVEMERDILKKLPPRSKNLRIEKKPKQ